MARTGKRWWIFGGVLLLMLGACSGEGPIVPDGPVLVQQNTLEPTLPVPTRALTNTPSRTPVVNQEVQSPLEIATVQADFVLVTPTLPPSKTPTTTPTISPTPTVTPTPSITVTATATRQLFPTSIILPLTAPVAAPIQQICNTQWFFIQPRPADCPLTPPTATQAVFQQFENGYMIWIGLLDAVYVMYSDMPQPRWQVFRDEFDEASMPSDDPRYATAPRDGLWQPRRGFGLLWRNNATVRDRIGWATMQWEQPYSALTQQAPDGTLFLSDPFNGFFGLLPGATGWQRYTG